MKMDRHEIEVLDEGKAMEDVSTEDCGKGAVASLGPTQK